MSEAKNWVVKCLTCGVEFDLREAPWCDHKAIYIKPPRSHEPVHTKLCPNGHCICNLLACCPSKFRPATFDERKYGFEVMLRTDEGGR